MALLLPAATAEMREWTSQAGERIEGELIEADADAQTLSLRRSDGQRFTFSWGVLSAADQDFLKAWCAEQAQEEEEPEAEAEKEDVELPKRFTLRGVPMVKQLYNYCAPASASMVVQFHGIDADQELIARLTSAESEASLGTYPAEMAIALEKLGFRAKMYDFHYINTDEDYERFLTETLPIIRRALVEQGPVYVSFKSGVFGSMGHGCVIIGYDDGREELEFHNPWGNEFERDYREFYVQARGIVNVFAPEPLPRPDEAFTKRVQAALPTLPKYFITEVSEAMKDAGIAAKISQANRIDEGENRRFAEETARKDGRVILDLAFNRASAVLMPKTDDDGDFVGLYYVVEPEEGARYETWLLDADGWHDMELLNLGDFTRTWVFRTVYPNERTIGWSLPLYELSEPGAEATE